MERGLRKQGGLYSTNEGVNAKRVRLLREWNWYKRKTEQLQRLKWEKNAAFKAMYKYFVDMVKVVATMETEEVFLEKYIAEHYFRVRWKEAKGTPTK